MAIESAELSLTGDRDDNQDRAAVAVAEGASLIVVMDGMGGHAWGARAAETGCKAMLELFRAESKPLFDPLGFLHLALGALQLDLIDVRPLFAHYAGLRFAGPEKPCEQQQQNPHDGDRRH